VAELLHSPLTLFIVQAAFIVAVSRLLGRLARVLGQPMVVAEIAAGIILGPSLFGLVAPHAMATIFPQASMGVLNLLAQVGLILFMFLIGLELDPKLLRGRGHTSVVISHSSIIVPSLLGLALGLYLHKRIAPAGVPYSSFVLFMAVSMSITAFPVLARILVERRVLKTKVGAVTITCAAVDDVTAWCLLAFVVSFVRAGGLAVAARTTGYALAYILAMLLVVRPFLGRLAARVGDREGMTQDRVAFTLILLLASSWTTELIGIHALFGAFLFGAVVPKEGGFARVLTEKLEDLVVVFLLPLFFAYSGLRTQIGLLNTAEAWFMCGLIVLVACAGKFGGSAVAARLTGLSWRESSAVGVLMNTRGLMELIAINIGLDLGVISPALFTMLVVMALVTTVATTPLLARLYPAGLARELLEPEPPAVRPRFTVLMCVASHQSGPGMMTLAGSLVGTRRQDARLYALRLSPPSDRSTQFVPNAPERPVAEALEPLVERAKSLDIPVRPIAFVSRKPAQDICDVARVKRADLVLLGWHKPLLSRTVLGGTVQDVIRHAPTNVGVFIDRGLSQVRKVLVPYQGGDDDMAAMRVAQRFTEQSTVQVTVLHVVTTGRSGASATDAVEEAFEKEAGGDRSAVSVKLVHDEPARAAIEEVRKGYDLVIVGAGAQWGLEPRLFGMVSEDIVRKCPASLLIVNACSTRARAEAQEPMRDPYPTASLTEATTAGTMSVAGKG
jgi:Kef-type K+ transport system membrane component KefB/nucleotide-binding universal stress UspA family protein